MSYYRAKLGSEKIIERSALKYTILRGTQFHNLRSGLFRAQRLSPVWFTPDVPVQPIDVHEVAGRLAGLASESPAGPAPDMGGPEVRSSVDLAEIFLEEASPRNHEPVPLRDRKSTRLNSSHVAISYAVFCLKKKKVVMNRKC